MALEGLHADPFDFVMDPGPELNPIRTGRGGGIHPTSRFFALYSKNLQMTHPEIS